MSAEGEHGYEATVRWQLRPGEAFGDNRYSRAHEWHFDGGVTVPASSSPRVVPPPLSDEHAVDPEEALVAALSSCHMLFFLAYAAKRGFVVESYEDRAVGSLGRNASGRTAMVRVALRPRVEWGGERRPSVEELAELHERAHHACYIANSVTAEVVVETR
jgi:organic hydroperoxide reductase OsmC/OhrA